MRAPNPNKTNEYWYGEAIAVRRLAKVYLNVIRRAQSFIEALDHPPPSNVSQTGPATRLASLRAALEAVGVEGIGGTQDTIAERYREWARTTRVTQYARGGRRPESESQPEEVDPLTYLKAAKPRAQDGPAKRLQRLRGPTDDSEWRLM